MSLVFSCLQVLGTVADQSLGGRDFDKLLADHFAEEFKARYKVDAKTKPKAYVRLLAECEKLKKLMSANATVNVVCYWILPSVQIFLIFTYVWYEREWNEFMLHLYIYIICPENWPRHVLKYDIKWQFLTRYHFIWLSFCYFVDNFYIILFLMLPVYIV